MATPLLSSPPLEGLDKGTPFPLLFILASKILSRLFLREELRGNLKSIRIVKSFLETYSAWSGQGINIRKSSMKGLKSILWKISWTILRSKVCISSLLSPPLLTPISFVPFARVVRNLSSTSFLVVPLPVLFGENPADPRTV